MARLPFLGEPELADLMGAVPATARRLATELVRDGWAETVRARSLELEPRRRLVVSEGALDALAGLSGNTRVTLPSQFPVRLRDHFERAGRLEITVHLNRLVADLAAGMREQHVADLEDARSLPLDLGRDQRWWPPRLQAYACLRAGGLYAPLFLTWDRAVAPDMSRRTRLRNWLRERSSYGSWWGSAGLPPLLVVAPGVEALEAWEDRYFRQSPLSGPSLDLLLTTAAMLQEFGPGGAVWSRPGGVPAPLVEQIGWGVPPPVPPVHISPDLRSFAPGRRSAPSLGARAREALERQGRPVWWKEVGALAILTGADHKRIVEWIGRHPLLSLSEFAAVIGESQDDLRPRVDWLIEIGAILTDDEWRPPDPEPVSDAASDPVSDPVSEPAGKSGSEPRYLLSAGAMRFMAARSGMNARSFASIGQVTFVVPGEQSLDLAIVQRAHTLGINRTMSRLAGDARAAGWRLIEWRNESESSQRLSSGNGVAFIRPDGSGVLWRRGSSRLFLLEYDRGSLQQHQFAVKFAGLRLYYEQRQWETEQAEAPPVLVVCLDNWAEEEVLAAAQDVAPLVPVMTTAEWRFLIDGRNESGLMGKIWRTPLDTNRRSWLESERGASGRERADSERVRREGADAHPEDHPAGPGPWTDPDRGLDAGCHDGRRHPAGDPSS